MYSYIVGLVLIYALWFFYMKKLTRTSYKNDPVVKRAKSSPLYIKELEKKTNDPLPLETAQNTKPNQKVMIFIVISVFIILLSPWKIIEGVKKIREEWRINHTFIPTTCVVQGKKIESHPNGQGGTNSLPAILVSYVVPPFTLSNWTTPKVFYRFSADTQVISEKYDRGMSYSCWYDPKDFNVVVLENGYSYTMNAFTRMLPSLLCIIVFLTVLRSPSILKNRFKKSS